MYRHLPELSSSNTQIIWNLDTIDTAMLISNLIWSICWRSIEHVKCWIAILNLWLSNIGTRQKMGCGGVRKIVLPSTGWSVGAGGLLPIYGRQLPLARPAASVDVHGVVRAWLDGRSAWNGGDTLDNWTSSRRCEFACGATARLTARSVARNSPSCIQMASHLFIFIYCHFIHRFDILWFALLVRRFFHILNVAHGSFVGFFSFFFLLFFCFHFGFVRYLWGFRSILLQY